MSDLCLKVNLNLSNFFKDIVISSEINDFGFNR